MIIPSNLYLNNQEKQKYENYIKKNIDDIEGVLVLLDVAPFSGGAKLDEYYKYISAISKKYKLQVIGFFNETLSSKFSSNMRDDIIKFEEQFIKFYEGGINVIIRPYRWYNYNFFKFSKLRFYIPSDSIVHILKRVTDKDIFFKHLDYLQNGIIGEVQKKEFKKSLYSKKVSMAHSDCSNRGDLFYKTLLKSDEKFLDEIDDIYFGKEFIYDDGFKYVTYGNVMGVYATDEQIDYLFKIQDELGISISLTMNSMDPPKDLVYDHNILKEFCGFLKKYYDRGLRVVTISDIHLMKTGILQKEFPKMKFKNTVNHKVADAQSFVNYCHLGYDYIQLDRSLNRDINELKKIKKINEKYGKKLYLLSSEYCMYNCPYKDEHDRLNQHIISAHAYFVGDNKLSHISCDNWRHGKYASMPRNGVDLILKDKDALDEYFQYIDVLKFSGRLTVLDDNYIDNMSFGFEDKSSLETKANSRLKSRLKITHQKYIPKKEEEYDTPEGERLLDFLKICKNECYTCHLCESVFGVDKFDSLIELNGDF